MRHELEDSSGSHLVLGDFFGSEESKDLALSRVRQDGDYLLISHSEEGEASTVIDRDGRIVIWDPGNGVRGLISQEDGVREIDLGGGRDSVVSSVSHLPQEILSEELIDLISDFISGERDG